MEATIEMSQEIEEESKIMLDAENELPGKGFKLKEFFSNALESSEYKMQ
jgi:hypothetical protein